MRYCLDLFICSREIIMHGYSASAKSKNPEYAGSDVSRSLTSTVSLTDPQENNLDRREHFDSSIFLGELGSTASLSAYIAQMS